MSIETTSGYDPRKKAYSEPVCLYDTVTDMAFGPTFGDQAEAEAFMRWLDKDYGLSDLRNGSPSSQKATADKWRKLLAEHKEEDCPYDIDQDSYGIGFTGDSDKSYGDYTIATPDACPCDCHRKPGGVFSHA